MTSQMTHPRALVVYATAGARCVVGRRWDTAGMSEHRWIAPEAGWYLVGFDRELELFGGEDPGPFRLPNPVDQSAHYLAPDGWDTTPVDLEH